ncbi:MAG: EI24 domain-containing protein [Planctomycetes bacterium]|nr:EI24 domain-containing protein [Planctomycetota bacterium]
MLPWMLGPELQALGQLGDRKIATVLLWCLLLSAVVFVLLWSGVAWALGWLAASAPDLPLALLHWLGALTALVLTWFLFPIVMVSSIALFEDRVAAAVEERHYPALPPAPGLSLLATIACTLRLLALLSGCNLVLVVLWFFPPAYAVGYWLLNGWLLGRSTFEAVALRRLDRDATRRLRTAHGGELLAAGIVLTFLGTIPVLNLLVPVVAIAAMVHRVEAWRPTVMVVAR